MEIFKLKVSIGNAEIELEGEASLVHTIFNEIREEGLGALNVVAMKQLREKEVNDNSNADSIQLDEMEANYHNGQSLEQPEILPALKNIVLQGTPKTEAEWLLVYSTYCSNQGTRLFTKEDLRAKYEETNRMNESRGKNFTTNLKSLVNNKYISAVNDSDFRIENGGLTKARAIIFETEDNKKTKRSKTNNTRKASTAKYNIIELALSEEDRSSLRIFWDEYDHSSNMDKAVLISFWLKNKKNIKDFTPDIFFTLLRTLEESASFDLLSSITNAKTKKNYFISGSSAGTYTLNHIGEDHVKALKLTRKDDKDNK